MTTPTPRTDQCIGQLATYPQPEEIIDLCYILERELAEARAERDALDRVNKHLTTMARAYSVDPSRITNTEIAMARVALDERSADLADLTRLRAVADELAKELSICRNALFIEDENNRDFDDITIHGYAIEAADAVLARYHAATNPASVAAVGGEAKQ